MSTDYLKQYSKAKREYKELELRFQSMTASYEKTIARLKKELLKPRVRFVSKMDDFTKVLQTCCLVCDVTPAQIMGTSRMGDIKDARHLFVYVLRQHYALRYTEIGRRLVRDHATIINSYRVAESYIRYNKDYAKLYNTVKELLGLCN